MLGSVERDDADRILVLAGHQVVDGAFEIGLSDIGFGKGDAKLSVIVDDKVIILIVAARHDGWGPACSRQGPGFVPD